MKEILVEWRKFLLQERVSDYLVQEIISYFFDDILLNWQKYYDFIMFNDPRFKEAFPNVIKDVKWAKKKKDRVERDVLFSRTWDQNVLFGLAPKTSTMYSSYQNFKKFQEKYRDTNKPPENIVGKEIISNITAIEFVSIES